MATRARPGLDNTEVSDSALSLVGETPIVRLSRVDPDLRTPLAAKVEFLNPGGSVKDRPAVSMIDAAEGAGALAPGGTLVEPTSGNTGLGLAMVAALRGYRVIAVMPDKMSREKIDTLRAFGAEVVVCPTDVPPDSPRSYYRVADRLTEEIDGAFQPNQYFNAANPDAHYRSTGPEIWRQTGGLITHFVVGVGTGGTISGAGRYLKEQDPEIEVVGADPEGSLYSGGPVHSYRVEGIGEDFWPDALHRDVIDRYITVSDGDSFVAARRLVAREGLFAGGSSGTALCAALRVARELDDPEALVVTLLPDGGRPYLSKIFNDHWMREHGYLAGGGLTAGDLLEAKGAVGELLTVSSHDEVGTALGLMQEHGVSQLPVVSAEDETVFVGSVSERVCCGRPPSRPGSRSSG
ncbi:MAG: pyridoxal-phosphate dependent enzyme [Solirubrobacterales bacterium]